MLGLQVETSPLYLPVIFRFIDIIRLHLTCVSWAGSFAALFEHIGGLDDGHLCETFHNESANSQFYYYKCVLSVTYKL